MGQKGKIWFRIKESASIRMEVENTLRNSFLKKGFEVSFNGEPGPSAQFDFTVGIGGDGTSLSTLRRLGERRYDTHFLGLHLSSGLGFLPPYAIPTEGGKALEIFSDDLADCIGSGNFQVEERWGLEVEIGGEYLWALNDFVISKGPLSRMILLRMHVNGELLLARMRGDGLICSSATGSTAYSLSAGGPVVQPTLNVVIVTPICPHEVSQRPLVLDSKSEIQIDILEEKSSLFLTCDGQSQKELHSGSILKLRRARKPVRWIIPKMKTVSPRSYFEQLRKKLKYGGDNNGSEKRISDEGHA